MRTKEVQIHAVLYNLILTSLNTLVFSFHQTHQIQFNLIHACLSFIRKLFLFYTIQKYILLSRLQSWMMKLKRLKRPRVLLILTRESLLLLGILEIDTLQQSKVLELQHKHIHSINQSFNYQIYSIYWPFQ